MLSKRIVFIVFLLLGLAVQPLASAEPAVQTQQIQQLSLDIQGMSCSLCPITIRKKLEKTPGVIEAKVDFDKKMAWVKYDADRVNSQALIEAINGIGYKASLHTAK